MFNEPSKLAVLLEKARLLSIGHHSDLVVCTNFLPWMDLALSADGEQDDPPGLGRNAIQRRWLEVAILMVELNETAEALSRNWTALASFGLVRGWHVSERSRWTHAHGPINLTLDGAPWFEPPRFTSPT